MSHALCTSENAFVAFPCPSRRSGACVIPGDVFNSQWPAASPWVTAVGATEPYTKGPDGFSATGSKAESAAALSSGGYSDRWHAILPLAFPGTGAHVHARTHTSSE